MELLHGIVLNDWDLGIHVHGLESSTIQYTRANTKQQSLQEICRVRINIMLCSLGIFAFRLSMRYTLITVGAFSVY